jgi:hypothetical protein
MSRSRSAETRTSKITCSQQAAGPCRAPPAFELGPSRHGLWVLRQVSGCGCAIFRDRAAAERYAVIESGGRPTGVIRVVSALEPDFGPSMGKSGTPSAFAGSADYRSRRETPMVRSVLGFVSLGKPNGSRRGGERA